MKEFNIKKNIINAFRKNKDSFISGESVSDSLGVSRACVWKYIEKLRRDGYEIEAVPNRGYNLLSEPEYLYGYDIAALLDTCIIGARNIYHYEEISSTNSLGYELAEKGEEEGTVIIAESQTGGKGRMGRKWISPGGSGIYLSVILRPAINMRDISPITLVTALSVANAIKSISGISPEIKWPNDIMIEGEKVCGILTEVKAQPDMVDFIIVGIGINVNTGKDLLPPGATSLKLRKGYDLNRKSLLKNILEEFEKDYLKFCREGFEPLRRTCKEMSLVLGKDVRISEHDRIVEGEAVDIDNKGMLIVRDAKGVKHTVFSGDVVLCRGMQPPAS